MYINIYIYYHTLVRVPDSGPGLGTRIWDLGSRIFLVVVIVLVVVLLVVVVVGEVIIVTSNHGEKQDPNSGPEFGTRIRDPNPGPFSP